MKLLDVNYKNEYDGHLVLSDLNYYKRLRGPTDPFNVSVGALLCHCLLLMEIIQWYVRSGQGDSNQMINILVKGIRVFEVFTACFNVLALVFENTKVSIY